MRWRVTPTNSYSLRTVLASYSDENRRAEMRTHWAAAVVYRYPSLLMAWPLIRWGVTPMQATLAGLGLALLLPVIAYVTPLGVAGIALCVAGALFQLLDCVDGAIARVTGKSSDTGARADFLVDMLQWGLLYMAIGILADRLYDTLYFWTTLGLFAGWLRLFARVVNDAAPVADAAADAPKETAAKRLGVGAVLMAFVEGLSGLVPFLALLGPYLYLGVVALIVYSLADVGDALMKAFK